MAKDQRITRLRKAIAEKELVETRDGSGYPIPLHLFPSTSTGSIVQWAQYSYDIFQLREFLRKAVQELTNKYNLDCIVFDCRPGPEPLFLAAAGISTEIILVTEADIITLNGNINLYRYLAEVYEDGSEVMRNIRFVINRIPKGQEVAHIKERYVTRLFDLFKTRPILASIPFDDAVFQSFGQHRFVVDHLTNSLFSRNVAAIALGLFSNNHEELLSDQCRRMASTLEEPWFKSSARAFVGAFGLLLRPRILR